MITTVPKSRFSQWRMRRRTPLGLALALLAAVSASAQAEIYRYQDADGYWQFTDRPPPGTVVPHDQDTAGASEPAGDRDLAQRLAERYRPTSSVQTCTLAVVKVETAIGNGSGFFVTDDGLIITSRHVVRPSKGWSEEREIKLAETKERLDAAERKLAVPRSRYVNPLQYDQLAEWYRKTSAQYRQARLDLDILKNRMAIESSFQIQLKDGTRLTARLLGTASDTDLALLQVRGYRTPYIEPLRGRAPRQGEAVYLIGSPLGVADMVSRGVFTGIHDGMFGTDAQILPGNSGGPMVTEDGQVIGINTIKLTSGRDSVMDAGLGFAIPISRAFAEFPRIGRKDSAESLP